VLYDRHHIAEHHITYCWCLLILIQHAVCSVIYTILFATETNFHSRVVCSFGTLSASVAPHWLWANRSDFITCKM